MVGKSGIFIIAMVILLAAYHDKLLSHDPSLLAVVSMVTKMDTPDGTSCNFLCLWILAQLSVGCEYCCFRITNFDTQSY